MKADVYTGDEKSRPKAAILKEIVLLLSKFAAVYPSVPLIRSPFFGVRIGLIRLG